MPPSRRPSLRNAICPHHLYTRVIQQTYRMTTPCPHPTLAFQIILPIPWPVPIGRGAQTRLKTDTWRPDTAVRMYRYRAYVRTTT